MKFLKFLAWFSLTLMAVWIAAYAGYQNGEQRCAREWVQAWSIDRQHISETCWPRKLR